MQGTYTSHIQVKSTVPEDTRQGGAYFQVFQDTEYDNLGRAGRNSLAYRIQITSDQQPRLTASGLTLF